jgi:hypothetical protein
MGGPRQRGTPGRSLKDLKKEIDTKNRSSAEVCILLIDYGSLPSVFVFALSVLASLIRNKRFSKIRILFWILHLFF